LSTTRGVRASSVSGVPVWDAAFKYAESKNIYAKKLLELAGRVYSDHETETHRGKWREAFPENIKESIKESTKTDPKKSLHLELGCNAGHVINQWAARDANTAFIGLDWKFKPIFRAAEKAIKADLGNLLFFRAHAERVRFMFAENELSRVSIFFPDPWPKKKHSKNRWITAERLTDIHHVLCSGGILHIKTDHPDYFDWIREAIEKTHTLWEVVSETRDLHAGNPNAAKLQIPEVTLFEKLFIHDGLPIHQVILKTIKAKP
jgi:tRNA (guanine-N7-)-methyltransferase